MLKGFALEDKGKSLLKKTIIPSRNAIGAIEEEGKKKMGDFLRDPLNLPFSLSDGAPVMSGDEGVRSAVRILSLSVSLSVSLSLLHLSLVLLCIPLLTNVFLL